uniref:Uncharacterized protein n=1 Tax=Arundo donax TaxID=35708 RepID=A0A0A9HBS0_ARUDO
MLPVVLPMARGVLFPVALLEEASAFEVCLQPLFLFSSLLLLLKFSSVRVSMVFLFPLQLLLVSVSCPCDVSCFVSWACLTHPLHPVMSALPGSDSLLDVHCYSQSCALDAHCCF